MKNDSKNFLENASDDSIHCFICNHTMEHFLSKSFNKFGLKDVDYVKCNNCGFVISKTHLFMKKKKWTQLNQDYHESFLNTEFNSDDPKWISRLKNMNNAIKRLHQLGIINNNLQYVDYGCGDGKLSNLLKNEGILVKKFDKFLGKANDDYITPLELKTQKYNLVINSSVFEHITQLKDLENIINLVDDNGCFALHTMVRETIPEDPSWSYFLPVHTSFYTNRSIDILFKR